MANLTPEGNAPRNLAEWKQINDQLNWQDMQYKIESGQSSPTYGGGYLAFESNRGQLTPTSSATPYNRDSGPSESDRNRDSGPSESDRRAEEARRAQEKAERRVRGDINTGYDSYLQNLDAQLGTLGTSRGAQESTIGSTFREGVGDLDYQLGIGQQSLGGARTDVLDNQRTNLRDISSNIRNAFQAGNVYLGARGAGDSSAANQYSYALNKQGTRQRSDVMQGTAKILGDIDARATDLQNIYNRETNSLTEKKNQRMDQLSMWFSDAQRQIQDAKGQAGLSRGQDLASLSKSLLDQAMSSLNQINAEEANQRNMLEQWAMGISTNIDQLRSNMQQTSQFSYNKPQAGQAPGLSVGSGGQPQQSFFGGGGGAPEERDRNKLFG